MDKLQVGINDLATVRPDIAKEWDFNKNKVAPETLVSTSCKKAWWLCSVGHSYTSKVSERVLQNKHCPCCLSNASAFERKVHKILDKEGIPYVIEYTPDDLSFAGRYDIYIHKERIMLELDGRHHFEDVYFEQDDETTNVKDVTERDNIKTQYTIKHGIYLLRIPYTYYKAINLKDIILRFIDTKKVPQAIIDFYSKYTDNCYADVARLQNKTLDVK